MSHANMKVCDRRGQIGDAPLPEEFCIAYRAQKYAEQLKCTQAEGSTNLISRMGKNGKNKSCSNKKESNMIRDVPIIWRKQSGDIVKGSFCEMDGEWYWSKVATCGVKSDLKERKKKEKKIRIAMRDEKEKIVS